MDHAFIIRRLQTNGDVFRCLTENLSIHEILWKPATDKWCMLEIVCHLHDEECDDFRASVKSVLENPELPFIPTDPPAWVSERKYMEQDFETMRSQFLLEREKSVEWLQSLKAPKWENLYQHPKVGPLSAEFFLANWLAHDYLHIRQINNLKYEFLDFMAIVKLDYAGNW